ncbi:hypothetical protein C0Q70_11435 [Pomacea canaliculata]|uniref:VWFA domain-containing protein n=1 Tax=Pomacea canaliculata TaxID=400727 RepID=A0A2T7P5Z8_POMCA|nr:circularly permutated Ras protein 1-like [Pomacea canaliculata]PVD28840.1 hypothetical protein C0Q70_11435 [Pomacea canaliculata]
MNFASPYVFYDTGTDAYEEVSDDEFQAGMQVSDSGSDEEPDHDYARPDQATPGVHQSGELAPERDGGLAPVRGDVSVSPQTALCAQLPPTDRISLSPPKRASFTQENKSKPKRQPHWKSSKEKSSSSSDSKPQKRQRSRTFRRADTNVVSVTFDALKTPGTMHAGEAANCARCEAILSHISKLETDGSEKVWNCEFCGNRNVVDIEEEEKPAASDVTFLVEPSQTTLASGPLGRDESLVIFCIDISGSMCVTSEISGHMRLRGGTPLHRLRSMNASGEDQHLPHQRRDVTYVSRLQAVQAAVDHQLNEMAKNSPFRRVGVVTFNCDVTVIGDGTTEVVTLAGEKLKNMEELTRLGSELPLPKAIKETCSLLGNKVFALEEGGPTALGSALVVALSMAAHQPGSKVILCTDGMANIGLGKLEDFGSEDPAEFYEKIAESASAKGVSVSVITIKGTDCKLVHLGKLSEKTGGQVNIVDPLKLNEQFSNILADRIIATGVVATFIVHCDLYIGSEENPESKERREIGNVTAEMEISFEFGIRKKNKPKPKGGQLECITEVSSSLEASSLLKAPIHSTGEPEAMDEGDTAQSNAGSTDGDGHQQDNTTDACRMSDVKREMNVPPELPFQLQIQYTDADGTKALRVLTQKKPVTHDRQLAEEMANVGVIGVHAARLSSDLALQGEYSRSRGVALMHQRLAWRSCHSSRSTSSDENLQAYRTVVSHLKTVENSVQQKQQREVELYGRTHSDDDDDDEEEANLAQPAAMNYEMDATSASTRHPIKGSKVFKKHVRSMDVDDGMAELMYRSRGLSTTSLDWKSKNIKK